MTQYFMSERGFGIGATRHMISGKGKYSSGGAVGAFDVIESLCRVESIQSFGVAPTRTFSGMLPR